MRGYSYFSTATMGGRGFDAQTPSLARLRARWCVGLSVFLASTVAGAVPSGNAEPEEALDAEVEGILDELSEDAMGGADLQLPFAAGADDSPTLRIHGFADFGISKAFMGKKNFIHIFFPRATTFLLGNLDLSFDARPADGQWRTYMELRFTNAPHGEDLTLQTPAGGTYERADSTAVDLDSASGRNKVLLGSVIIERAWFEWAPRDAFRLRVGSWFTPYGIWNLDHGTPTLISLLLPDSQLQEYFPLRQTGLQAHGAFFAGPWELGYHAYISNGRTITTWDLNDKKALGGRLFFRRNGIGWDATFGMSGYQDRILDVKKRIVSFEPLIGAVEKTVVGDEWALAADVTLNFSRLRFRSEVVMRRVTYRPGKRPPVPSAGPQAVEPDHYQWNAYELIAYELPWWGLEPYLWFEWVHRPHYSGDTALIPSAGLNIHFSAALQLKLQASSAFFVDLQGREEVQKLAKDRRLLFLACRLVVAF